MNFGRNILIVSAAVLAALGFLLYEQSTETRRESSAEALVFYCAAGIKHPVERIAKEYEQEYGTPIQIQYGGSGTLLSNITVTGDGDLYLSADESYIGIAKEKGLLREAIPVAYLVPVIAVQEGNPKGIRGLEDLYRSDVRVAVANPDAASVGKVTKTLFEELGQWEALSQNVTVLKPTVNEVANDVKIGSVDAGVIWDAVANQYPEIEAIEVPQFVRDDWRITIGVLEGTERPSEALHFARYLTARDKGLTVFDEMGYKPVDGDVWAETPRLVLFSGGVNRMAIDETVNEFEEREGVKVERVYNGCGILVSQMLAGASPDAYFACDISFSNQVADMFLDFSNISKTRMVILTQKGNPKNIETLEDLTEPGLKVGMANAEQSALGALTVRLLDETGITEAFMKNVSSQTPTADLLVNQTQVGGLDAAIVYEANTSQVRDKLEVIHIDHPAALAVQPFAVNKTSDHKYLMNRLYETILSKHSEEKFESVGFEWLADRTGHAGGSGG